MAALAHRRRAAPPPGLFGLGVPAGLPAPGATCGRRPRPAPRAARRPGRHPDTARAGAGRWRRAAALGPRARPAPGRLLHRARLHPPWTVLSVGAASGAPRGPCAAPPARAPGKGCWRGEGREKEGTARADCVGGPGSESVESTRLPPPGGGTLIHHSSHLTGKEEESPGMGRRYPGCRASAWPELEPQPM